MTAPRLWAIGDLHLGMPANREALAAVPRRPRDWLILAGDVGELPEHLEHAFTVLGERFARLLWVPGNHELWTLPGTAATARGVAKYEAMLAVCRRHGVATPEDEWPLFAGAGGPVVVALLFLLYDYGFRPPDVARHDVVAWAEAESSVCADEACLHPDPYPTREAWCAARVAAAEARLAALPPELPTVLVNHWPLRRDLVHLPRIPRFAPWCGTPRAEDWHRRFRARAVVSGHLHVPRTEWRDGVRCEEVSLGYPRQWDAARGVGGYLREILPAGDAACQRTSGTRSGG